MKQADLEVGQDYAFPTYKPLGGAPVAARVRVVSADGAGKATVKVIDPGPKPPDHAWDATPVKRNEKRQVNTRSLVCPWEEWADHVAAIDAERKARAARAQSWHDEYERKRADRVRVDSDRPLPDEYDENDRDFETEAEERSELGKTYIKVRGLGQYANPDERLPASSRTCRCPSCGTFLPPIDIGTQVPREPSRRSSCVRRIFSSLLESSLEEPPDRVTYLARQTWRSWARYASR